MRFVRSKDIKPGMILAKNILDDSGHVLLTAGSSLTQFQVYRVQGFEFPGIYIYDKATEAIEINEVISEKLRIDAINSMKRLNIEACITHAKSIVEEVLDAKTKMIELNSLSSYHNYTYNHCINVAQIAVVLGIGLGFTNDELKNLSIAALMHDIGKSAIPIDLLDKKEKLTNDEFDLIKSHAELGYNMLKENIDIPATVRVSIYEHHENEDGSGYPRKLQGDKIHKFAKIIHIADVFDAMVSKRAYKDEINPTDALEFINSNCGKMFNYDYVKIFNDYVVLYPTGSRVKMSNGQEGYVMINYQGQPTRPDILLDDGQILELRFILNITITGIMK